MDRTDQEMGRIPLKGGPLQCLMQIIDVGPTKSRLQFSAQPQSERLPRTQKGTFRDSAQAILEIALTWPHPKLTKCCSNGALHI